MRRLRTKAPSRPGGGDVAGKTASPGLMTMFQPSRSKVCLQWPWSPLAAGKPGHGSSTSVDASKLTFVHEDAFGKGTHTVELVGGGTRLKGRYQATARADGARVSGTVTAPARRAPEHVARLLTDEPGKSIGSADDR
jgi:hypothetical protein